MLFLLLAGLRAHADKVHRLDSLLEVLKNKGEDTSRVIVLNRIVNELQDKGDYSKALGFCKTALRLADSLGYKRGAAYSCNLEGVIYKEMGNYPVAIEMLLRALQLKEELKDMNGVATANINIGNIYFNQEKYPEALSWFFKALRISEKYSLTLAIATCHGNLGISYNVLKNLDSAAWYYEKSIEERTALHDSSGLSGVYSNMGILRWDQGKLDEALDYMMKGLAMSEQLGNKLNVVVNCVNIGEIWLEKKDYEKGKTFIQRSIDLARSIGARDKLMHGYESMSEAWKRSGDHARALEYYDRYVGLKDSLMNESNNKSIAEMQARYETEKKQSEIELLKKDHDINELRMGKENENESRQRIMIFSFSGMGILLLATGLFVTSNFLQKRKANILLSQVNAGILEQKIKIEQKNDYITGSLNVAKNIQEKILPRDEKLRNALGEYFILHLPKDIVSGDFYYIAESGKRTFLAVIDCTGHGVPGALMSLHAYGLFEKIKQEKNVFSPAQLLDELNLAVKNSISAHDDDHSEKFGMDMQVISIDRENNILHFAGARNPVYILRREGTGDHFLMELKADRVSIGSATQNFTDQKFELQSGDMIYLFSDGYADQVGGPYRKKYLSGNFKLFLQGIAHLPLDAQRQKLLELHREWKGNFSQTDDVLVVGIKVAH
ncbi:MAG TPA: tetratricopeptide repeat protein [Bacteroidia bacterium]